MSQGYNINRYVSVWLNDGKDGNPDYYTITIRKRYKDTNGEWVEKKETYMADEAIQIAAGFNAAIDKILLLPKKIVKKEATAEPNMQVVDVNDLDGIPF